MPPNTIGQTERATQNRVIALFRDESYRYLGDLTDQPNNSNIEPALLTTYLTKNDYTPAQISSAIYKLRTEAIFWVKVLQPYLIVFLCVLSVFAVHLPFLG